MMITKEALENFGAAAGIFGTAMNLMASTIDSVSTISPEDLEKRKEILRENLQCAAAHLQCGFEQLISQQEKSS